MDLAYDHIQEEALVPEERPTTENKTENTLNSDFQEAYKVISSSPWGIRLGGFLGNIVKQGGEVYKEAQRELSEVSEEANRGFSGLRSSIINRTGEISFRNLSSSTGPSTQAIVEDSDIISNEGQKESPSVLSRLKSEAAKRLREIERAEDAADEVLLKFGTNIRDFLQNAITIAPPSSSSNQETTQVTFESKDGSGKRVIHTTRFDAQLHVIHTCLDSFTKDPISDEFEPWSNNFNIEEKKEAINTYLKTHNELRQTMEKLVPDIVSNTSFWTRYFFLRHSIETAEARRRDLLKGAATSTEEEEVGWDEESENENEVEVKTIRDVSVESSMTLQQNNQPEDRKYLKPEDPRKSQDSKSIADSDASYDVVGPASATLPESPPFVKKVEESEEEDWE